MATIVESKDLSPVPKLVGLVGTQGKGKTTCALSASEGYAKGDCADTMLLAFDLDATVGPQSRGINVPTIQLSGINDWTIMQKEIEDTVKLLTERVKTGKTKNVIFDTVSLLDSMMLSYFAPRSADNFVLYASIGKWHRWFIMDQFMPLTALGARLIAVFQPNYKETPDDKKKEDKQKVLAQRQGMGVEPDAEKLLAVSGKEAAKLYRTQCSIIAPVDRTKKAGLNAGYDYWLYPNGGGLGFEYKNRYHFLDEKEPADLCALYKKIANHKP